MDRTQSPPSLYLNDLLDERFVRADLGPLERVHVDPDPRDEHKLGSLAFEGRLLARRQAKEAKQAIVVCNDDMALVTRSIDTS